MNKTALVFKYELLNILRSRSYMLILILVPLISFGTLLVISSVQKSARRASESGSSQEPASEVQGFVDQSRLIQSIPIEIASYFEQYPDLTSAAQALENGDISAFYIISADYLTSGEVAAYRRDFNPFTGMETTETLTYLINSNLLRDDPQILSRIIQPYNLNVHYLTPQSERDSNAGLAFFLPYVVTFLIYLLILSSASLLLNSVAKEKENRIMEILLTSVKPIELLSGKIVALGLMGLFQTLVWTTAGLLMLRFSGQAFSLPQDFQLPASILIWGMLFFLLGYAVYASLMAGIGALVPNLRESAQATLLVMVPLIIPMMFISAVVENPNSTVSVGFSLFPLTASVTMMTRLAVTQIPVWQPILAVLFEAITAALIIRAVAGMFHAKNLLTGSEFKFSIYLRALFGRL